MSALKYKSGDKVRINDIDWYNKNKDSNGNVTVLSKVPHFSWCETVRTVFTKDMAKFCGKVVTIESVWSVNYTIVEGTYRDGINIDYFTDEMIEGLVEDENKPLTYEETVEIIEAMQGIGDSWECPQGYQFVDENGNVINTTKIVLEKKTNKEMGENNIKVDMGEVSDGYHTFNELYEYRMLYNAALFNEFAKQGTYDVHKSRKHSDGEYPFGDSNWFIVMAELPTGQISNHYEMKDWDKFQIPEKPLANKWDGHSPRDVAERLTSFMNPKFKVNDIVFVKNIGWIRITNSYWDSLANEYIYEAIGFNGEGEYDSINESNIECQMLPESENPHTGGNKITLDEYKNNDKEWLFNKLAMLDNITALESIQDIFNHLQQSKYPKTYEECCDVLSIQSYYKLRYYTYEHGYNEYATSNKLCSLSDKLNILGKLLICLDAYWKIAGDEMGLGKPWEPDWNNISDKYCIYFVSGDAWLKECQTRQCIFAFLKTANLDDADLCGVHLFGADM